MIAFRTIINAFNSNNDGITVLKQSVYHAVTLAKIVSYAPHFHHFLEAPPPVFKDYTPLQTTHNQRVFSIPGLTYVLEYIRVDGPIETSSRDVILQFTAFT